ncbi:MAG: tol-pal system YbgF family protein [Saprospiraceae bacterium]
MELRCLIIGLVLALTACQSNSSKIDQLTQALSANPTKENRDALIVAYQDSINARPNDAATNAPFLTEMANLHVTNKNYVRALQTLMQGLQDYPKSSDVPTKVWTLANIYEQYIQRPNIANTVKKLYVQRFPSGANIAAAKQAAMASKTTISEDIVALGGSMYDETTHKVDFQAANDYIRMCELFALLKPQDGLSPDYLHKAGETARAIRAFPQAVDIYDRIYTQYPTYEKAAQALFLKAFTYDNDLGDKATAKVLYEEFLKKFPNDDFADDTQFLLSNLGKDDEEIIKSFGEK